jgi:hypothetical protein
MQLIHSSSCKQSIHTQQQQQAVDTQQQLQLQAVDANPQRQQQLPHLSTQFIQHSWFAFMVHHSTATRHSTIDMRCVYRHTETSHKDNGRQQGGGRCWCWLVGCWRLGVAFALPVDHRGAVLGPRLLGPAGVLSLLSSESSESVV